MFTILIWPSKICRKIMLGSIKRVSHDILLINNQSMFIIVTCVNMEFIYNYQYKVNPA